MTLSNDAAHPAGLDTSGGLDHHTQKRAALALVLGRRDDVEAVEADKQVTAVAVGVGGGIGT